MPKYIVVIAGVAMLALAAGLGFFFALGFPQHQEVATLARWVGLAGAPLLLVSLAIDRAKAK